MEVIRGRWDDSLYFFLSFLRILFTYFETEKEGERVHVCEQKEGQRERKRETSRFF